MPNFKCISCGEVKESEQRCSCPICGYEMYQMPYDRKELLKDEITRFVRCVIRPEIQAGDIIFDGKEKDDRRFPGFEKMISFAFSAEKTEVFVKRLHDIAENLKKHFHESFSKKYVGSKEELFDMSERSAEQLAEIMAVLGIEQHYDELRLPEIQLMHSEVPNESLADKADELCERLGLLADKIHKFIVRNNMYSVTKTRPRLNELPDNIDAVRLMTCRAGLDTVLEKKYIVDILDDGSEQLNEMLGAFWNAVNLMMAAPILMKSDIYSIDGGGWLPPELFLPMIADSIADRFKVASEIVNRDVFLSDKNEEALFDIYNKMLELDKYGYMKVSRGNFIVGESEKKLNALIGLTDVKSSIRKIKAFAAANKGREDLSLHMCFLGNPGTGKTEVARVIAGILHENGILPSSKVVETDRSGLVAGYVGQTALKTQEIIEQAMGGVLFIDEAYSLIPKDSPSDYGYEAIATLIKAMEDARGRFCVIFAGYRNPMQEMLTANQGLRSRIQFTLDFPNYSRGELKEIAHLMLGKSGYTISEQAMDKLLDITDIKRKSSDFANAREVRNILEQVMMCQSLRCAGTNDRELAIADVNSYIKDAKINLPTTGEGHKKQIMTADEELDALVGLTAVKRMVKKIRAYAKRNKDSEDFNLHMCFLGNPGTGKTEVARILSRLLYDAGVLPEAKLCETDAHGMMGKFVGETAPKTLAKINDAMGGVLFIDEAYALTDSDRADVKAASYGDEAVSVLLKEMEDRRGQFCVILAGYRDEMKQMLSANPGFESRIEFTLDFPDFTKDELGEIALRMLEKKHYEITDEALELVLNVCEYYRQQQNFANARTLRNVLDQVIMNQNLRADESGEDEYLIIPADVEDYIADEAIEFGKASGGNRIGFR